MTSTFGILRAMGGVRPITAVERLPSEPLTPPPRCPACRTPCHRSHRAYSGAPGPGRAGRLAAELGGEIHEVGGDHVEIVLGLEIGGLARPVLRWPRHERGP